MTENLVNKIWADLEALDNFCLKILELHRHESEALDEKFSADLSILLDRQSAGLREFDDGVSSSEKYVDLCEEIADRFLREEHELCERFLVEKCEFAKRVFNSHRDEFHVFLREHPAAAAVREGTT